MKNALIMISFLSVLVLSPFNAGCEEIKILSWAPYSGVSRISLEGSIVNVASNNSFPLLMSKDPLFINAARTPILQVVMKSETGYTTGRIFFKRIGDSDFSSNNSYELQTGIGGAFHDYVIDLTRNPNWYGVITHIMYSPINQEGSAQVKSFSFRERSSWLLFRSRIQEFLTFEVPQLRTFNFIYGPRIGGISINLYVYFIIIFASIIIVALELIGSRDPLVAFNRISKNMIIICILSWMLMDGRAIFDQARYAAYDMSTFHGRSLEQKRALVTLGDFYDFLSFCSSKVPKGASFSHVFPNYYYFREKAMYYMYPAYYAEKADYILVYDPNRNMDAEIARYAKEGYRVFAAYKEGELILKK